MSRFARPGGGVTIAKADEYRRAWDVKLRNGDIVVVDVQYLDTEVYCPWLYKSNEPPIPQCIALCHLASEKKLVFRTVSPLNGESRLAEPVFRSTCNLDSRRRLWSLYTSRFSRRGGPPPALLETENETTSPSEGRPAAAAGASPAPDGASEPPAELLLSVHANATQQLTKQIWQLLEDTSVVKVGPELHLFENSMLVHHNVRLKNFHNLKNMTHVRPQQRGYLPNDRYRIPDSTLTSILNRCSDMSARCRMEGSFLPQKTNASDRRSDRDAKELSDAAQDDNSQDLSSSQRLSQDGENSSENCRKSNPGRAPRGEPRSQTSVRPRPTSYGRFDVKMRVALELDLLRSAIARLPMASRETEARLEALSDDLHDMVIEIQHELLKSASRGAPNRDALAGA